MILTLLNNNGPVVEPVIPDLVVVAEISLKLDTVVISLQLDTVDN